MTVFSVDYRFTAASIDQERTTPLSLRENRNAQQPRGMNDILILKSSLLLAIPNVKKLENFKSELASGISILLIFSIAINQSFHFRDAFFRCLTTCQKMLACTVVTMATTISHVNNTFPPRPLLWRTTRYPRPAIGQSSLPDRKSGLILVAWLVCLCRNL